MTGIVKNPFKKNLNDLPLQAAHSGSGRRQLILSPKDAGVSANIDALTRGYLPARGTFDWHSHDGIDEFFIVLEGSGIIDFKSADPIRFAKDDAVYIPSHLEHRISNTSSEEITFLFFRIIAD
jgi:mannose-6-phosphate isomerase-like protein (cupin superfamily)